MRAPHAVQRARSTEPDEHDRPDIDQVDVTPAGLPAYLRLATDRSPNEDATDRAPQTDHGARPGVMARAGDEQAAPALPWFMQRAADVAPAAPSTEASAEARGTERRSAALDLAAAAPDADVQEADFPENAPGASDTAAPPQATPEVRQSRATLAGTGPDAARASAAPETQPPAEVASEPAADAGGSGAEPASEAGPVTEAEAPATETAGEQAAEADAPEAEQAAEAEQVAEAEPTPAAGDTGEAAVEAGAAMDGPAAGGGGGGGGGASMPDAADIAEAPEVDAESDGGRDAALDDEAEAAEIDAEMQSIGADVEAPPMSGGGGGGAAISPEPPPPAPEIATASPEAGVAQLDGLRPDVLAGALGGLGQSVAQAVTEKRDALAAAPPTRGTHGGGEAPEAPPPNDGEAPPADPSEGADMPAPPPPPTPPTPGAPPSERVTAPVVAGGEGGTLSEAETRQMASSISGLPTADPAARRKAGPVPRVPQAGNADPGLARRDRGDLENRATVAKQEAHKAASQPMGEDAITVTLPPTTLSAQLPSRKPAAPPDPPTLPGDEQAAIVGIIAGKQQGDRIQAALDTARADMAAERQSHTEAEQQARAQSDASIAQLEGEAAAEQARQKAAARKEVESLRGDWKSEVDSRTGEARKQADAKVKAGLSEVEGHKQKGDREAAKAHAEGDAKAETARKTGEAKAAKLKKDGEKESDGFFGWLASKAKAFFDRLKRGITAALDAARAAVKAAIDKAKRLAAAAIEFARKAIVKAIEIVGDALIAIGDKLLAGFPGLRDRFRAAIEDRVRKATAAVNAAAKALNEGIQKALDALGEGLDAALRLLEKGLHAIVDGIGAAVKGALDAAQSVVDGVAAFAALIKDVASDPLAWLANLGAAVVDGIKNHLWKAFQAAVKEWFASKLMEVLGIGGMVIEALKAGGFEMPDIVKTAWEGLKAAIPIALVTILVEKLVAMIVPAAGAVMVIIEGLQAAWGTVSRIIAAFAAFMAFLQQVKSGDAGPAFAKALAAAAVVVIDFVANWLLKKIRKAGRAIGKRLKGIAKTLGRRRRGGKGKAKGKRRGKDGKDKSKDMAAARREAKRAARKGWSLAKGKASKRVMKKAEVERALGAAEGTRGGAKVKLDAKVQGKGWAVEATASKRGKRAKASHGRGSILKSKQGGSFYAAVDIRTVEKRVERMTRDALAKEAKQAQKGKGGGADAIKGALARIEAKGQKMLDARVKGVDLSLKVRARDRGRAVTVAALVQPNYHEWEIELDSGGLDAIKTAIRQRGRQRYNTQLLWLRELADTHSAVIGISEQKKAWDRGIGGHVYWYEVTFTKGGDTLKVHMKRGPMVSGPGSNQHAKKPKGALSDRRIMSGERNPDTGKPMTGQPHDAFPHTQWKNACKDAATALGVAHSDGGFTMLLGVVAASPNAAAVADGPEVQPFDGEIHADKNALERHDDTYAQGFGQDDGAALYLTHPNATIGDVRVDEYRGKEYDKMSRSQVKKTLEMRALIVIATMTAKIGTRGFRRKLGKPGGFANESVARTFIADVHTRIRGHLT